MPHASSLERGAPTNFRSSAKTVGGARATEVVLTNYNANAKALDNLNKYIREVLKEQMSH